MSESLVLTDPLVTVRQTVTFTGAAGLGQVGSVPLFTTKGKPYLVSLTVYCIEDLVSAGGGSISLGVIGDLTLFIPATLASSIDQGHIWVSGEPNANGIAVPALLRNIVIAKNILVTVTVGDVTAGELGFVARYLPESLDGQIV